MDDGLLNSHSFDCRHGEIILQPEGVFSFVDGILNAIPVLLLCAFDPSVKICIELLYCSPLIGYLFTYLFVRSSRSFNFYLQSTISIFYVQFINIRIRVTGRTLDLACIMYI